MLSATSAKYVFVVSGWLRLTTKLVMRIYDQWLLFYVEKGKFSQNSRQMAESGFSPLERSQ